MAKTWQDVEKLKAEGEYHAAGALAKKIGSDRSYGAHFGMRSGRQQALADFYAGYDAPVQEAFGRIVVAKNPGDAGVTLTIANRDAYDETLRRLDAYRLSDKANGDKLTIKDHFWGYSLHKTADQAIDVVEAFITNLDKIA